MRNYCSSHNDKSLCFPINPESKVVLEKPKDDACDGVCITNSFINILPGIAWPIATLFIILLLKNPLKSLLADTENFSFKEFKWTRRKIEKVASRMASERIVPEITGEYEIDDLGFVKYLHLTQDPFDNERVNTNKVYRLLKIHPRAAMLESWVGLEIIIKDLLDIQKIDSRKHVELFTELHKRGYISKDQLIILQDLRKIRNKIAHTSEEFSVETGASFVNAVLQMSYFLLKKIPL